MDTTAHNVANAQTPGFREQRVALRDTAPGVAADAAGLDPQQAPLQQTGQPLDLAIAGAGFFQVRAPDGQIALTRDGTFTTDAAGRIVTRSGAELVPSIGIPVAADPSSVAVAPDGAVTAGGIALGSIALVDVPAPQGLMAIGGNLYVPTIASGAPTAATGARVQQGYVEMSNTNVVGATVDMIAIQHAFAANVRAIEAQDEMLRSMLGLGRADHDER